MPELDGPDVTAELEARLRAAEDALRAQGAEIAMLRGVFDTLADDVVRKTARPLDAIDRGPRRRRESFDPTSVRALYSRRFSADELVKKRAIWQSLTPFFERRFPAQTSTVLEVGSGEGEFLEFCHAPRRLAVDLKPSAARLRALGIEAVSGDATRLFEHVDDESVDVVFCSNVLEHLYDRDQVHLLLREVRHVLRPGGRFLLLQPDIRRVGFEYYDFIDHRLEFTCESFLEALGVAGLTVIEKHERFLPFTTKSRLSAFYWAVPLYLRLPLVWRLLGKQCFIVAEKR